jgi:hypothetical protein
MYLNEDSSKNLSIVVEDKGLAVLADACLQSSSREQREESNDVMKAAARMVTKPAPLKLEQANKGWTMVQIIVKQQGGLGLNLKSVAGGFVVIGVKPKSLCKSAGVERGDFLDQIKSLEDLKQRKPNGDLAFRVLRRVPNGSVQNHTLAAAIDEVLAKYPIDTVCRTGFIKRNTNTLEYSSEDEDDKSLPPDYMYEEDDGYLGDSDTKDKSKAEICSAVDSLINLVPGLAENEAARSILEAAQVQTGDMEMLKILKQSQTQDEQKISAKDTTKPPRQKRRVKRSNKNKTQRFIGRAEPSQRRLEKGRENVERKLKGAKKRKDHKVGEAPRGPRNVKDKHSRKQLRGVLRSLSENYWPMIYPQDKKRLANWPNFHVVLVIVDGIHANGLNGGRQSNGCLHRPRSQVYVYAPSRAAEKSVIDALSNKDIDLVSCRMVDAVMDSVHHETIPGKARGKQWPMTGKEVKKSNPSLMSHHYVPSSTDQKDDTDSD